MRTLLLMAGVVVLASAWLGPLPALATHSFAAHMGMHMAVVAVAAPLLARAVAGTSLDPARALPWMAAPIVASVVELVVVWGWHAPSMHALARHHTWALALEQGTFLTAGLWLWMAACGGGADERHRTSGAGIVALLLTSMHMTLLGALFALANRPLFPHATPAPGSLTPLDDQHLGGAIMLLVGGVSYLAGGLWLTARVLRAPVTHAPTLLAGSERAS